MKRLLIHFLNAGGVILRMPLLMLAGLSLTLASCGKSGEEVVEQRQTAPTDVAVRQVSEHGLQISWNHPGGSHGIAVYLTDASDIDNQELKATLDADAKEYLLEDESLKASGSYYIGVQAKGSKESLDSKISKVLYTMAAPADPNAPSVTLTIKPHDVLFRADLALTNANSKHVCGICWSETVDPEVGDAHQDAAPLKDDDRTSRTISLSNALFDYSKTYNFRAYIKDENKVYYSPVVQATLGKEPDAITLAWHLVTTTTLPASVELYSYEGLMNGRNCRAWYAIADLSKGDVEFKVRIPDAAATVDDQFAAEKDCLVMVNGGYFYDGRNTGIAYVNSVLSGAVSAVRGSLKTEDAEYNELYNVTRGLFGVDAAGKPFVSWVSSDASNKALFFDRPLPSVKGEAKYAIPSDGNPAKALTLSPKYAQSAGPLLLMDGKCPFNFENTDNGEDFYISNYEIMPYDIYGTTVKPDRTAAGYTADGKVVLLIIDGRIEESDGATLTELAAIMKGIGCVGAVNFDGGGSTAMVVGGKHLNDVRPNNRPVLSTLGIYRK